MHIVVPIVISHLFIQYSATKFIHMDVKILFTYLFFNQKICRTRNYTDVIEWLLKMKKSLCDMVYPDDSLRIVKQI